jgi:hypothetical protein
MAVFFFETRDCEATTPQHLLSEHKSLHNYNKERRGKEEPREKPTYLQDTYRTKEGN